MVIIRADWIPTDFQIGDTHEPRANKEQLFFESELASENGYVRF